MDNNPYEPPAFDDEDYENYSNEVSQIVLCICFAGLIATFFFFLGGIVYFPIFTTPTTVNLTCWAICLGCFYVNWVILPPIFEFVINNRSFKK